MYNQIFFSFFNYYRTLLHYCCMSNIPIEDFYLIKLLMIELKMDINQPDQKGLTPLLYASYSGNYCIVRYILANCAEANIMAVDNEMNNILHLACLSRSKLTGVILIEHAKQCGQIEKLINGKNHHEQIPLHLAAKKLMPTLIKELLFSGSPWDCYDSFGYSPSLYCTPTRLSAICLSLIGLRQGISPYLQLLTTPKIEQGRQSKSSS